MQASSCNWHEGTNDYAPFVTYMLGVLAAVQRFCAKREAMVEIAADGQIAESEQAEWDEIMCLANDLNVAMNNMRFSKGGRQS